MSCYPVTNTVSHHRIEFYTNSIGFHNNTIKKTTIYRITFFVKCVLGLIPVEFNVVLLVLIDQITSHKPNTWTNGDQRPLVSIKTNTAVLITITSNTISVMFSVFCFGCVYQGVACIKTFIQNFSHICMDVFISSSIVLFADAPGRLSIDMPMYPTR